MFSTKTIIFTLASALITARFASAICDIDITSANPSSLARTYCINYGICTTEPALAKQKSDQLGCQFVAEDDELELGQDESFYTCPSGDILYELTYYLAYNTTNQLECSILEGNKVYPWSEDNYIKYVKSTWVDRLRFTRRTA